MKETALLLLLILLLSCGSSKVSDKSVYYSYGFDSGAPDKPTDSILFYPNDNLKSLELYNKKDSLHFFAVDNIYLGIFTLNSNKFAVIADTASTAIYNFKKRNWKEVYRISETELGSNINILQKDLNYDGYEDAIIQYISGGFYGEDDVCLLYDPKSKNFDYPNMIKLHDITFGDSQEIVSNWKFNSEYYLIKDFKFIKTIEEVFLQGDLDVKKIVKKFNLQGMEISRDTVTIDTQ